MRRAPRYLIGLDTTLEAIEGVMRGAGFGSTEELRPVNEARMFARWKLGER
jgi:hypothetical protein